MWPSHLSILSATTLCASREHLVVWSFVLPGDSEFSSQTAKMEGVQLLQLFAVQRPGLGAMQKNGGDIGFVHLDLCEQFEVAVELNFTR